jgi:peroxiredoxin
MFKSRRPLLGLGFMLCLAAMPAAHALGPYATLDGAQRSLEDYTGKGKWTVVMIWASDCPVCNREVNQYIKFHDQHKGTDAEVIGISMDGPDNKKHADGFVARHKVNFPNLLPEPMAVVAHYRESTGQYYQGTPSFLVYNPKGELIGAQAGAVPTQVIEEFIARETADAAANEKKTPAP